MFKTLLYERVGNTIWIRFNRPDALNALSPELIQDFARAIRHVSTVEKDVRALVTTGQGKAYSAGVDLKALQGVIQDGHFAALEDMHRDALEAVDTMQSLPFPTIAMINGFCYTGAMELMLAHDLIYAAEECTMADTHAKWGIAPKWGMSQRLPLRVGLHAAMELSFTCRLVTGIEAQRMGLVNSAVPGVQLEAYVKGRIEEISKNSAQTVALMKRLYYYGGHRSVREGLKYEQEDQTKLTDRGGVDFKKGMTRKSKL